MHMLGELRIKAQMRENFGKYVDPRIVAGLIHRPELTNAKGSRREMAILFCDMKVSYTVIGDSVNLASRVEGANKTYGTRVLISEATNRLALDTVEAQEIDSVLVVGKTEPLRIFELFGRSGEVAREHLALRDAYVDALDAYRRKAWEEARAMVSRPVSP